MALFEAMQRRMRALKLRRMLEDREPGASRLQEIVDLIIMQAYCDEAAGIRKDKVLFSFESTFEEISDRIALIRENGDTETYRDIYSKLYAFADEMMADSYMPMYLFIMYRYANALLETGEQIQVLENLLIDVGGGLYAKVTQAGPEGFRLAITAKSPGFADWLKQVTVKETEGEGTDGDI